MREAILLLATFAIMALAGVTRSAENGADRFGSTFHSRRIHAVESSPAPLGEER